MEDPSKRRERLSKLRQDILEKKNATTMGILDNLVDMKKTYTRLGESLSSPPKSPELTRIRPSSADTRPPSSISPSTSLFTSSYSSSPPSSKDPFSPPKERETATPPPSSSLLTSPPLSSSPIPTPSPLFSSSPILPSSSPLKGSSTIPSSSLFLEREATKQTKSETYTPQEPAPFVFVNSGTENGDAANTDESSFFGAPFPLSNEVTLSHKKPQPSPLDLPLPHHWISLIDPVEGTTIYYNEFTKESSTTHPYYFQMWNVDPREGITVRQALAEDGWDKYLDPNTNRYFYYNSNTGETTWTLPVHRYVAPAPPSTNSTSSPAGLRRKASRKEEVEVPRKAETRAKPLAVVGDKWVYAPEDVAEFNTNHPVASSILYSIHEELVSLPEPSTSRNERERDGGETGSLDLWDLYNEEMTMALGYAHHTELDVVRPPWYWRGVAVSSRYIKKRKKKD
eukprot:Phypoly_transcript_08110.p1 GENE.Phypoly_transcript_08110~~Phypoly_transcript_08110.p1  ORF type:complete len:454 (+),score=134.87 Phypoly_transcript_08110:83-1444(+)